MITCTQEVRDLFMASHRQVIRITMTDASESVTEITEDNILVGGLVIDRYSMCSNRIEIGSAVASELALTLQNMSGTFDNVNFEGTQMHVELGVKDWDDEDSQVQWISMGYFVADSQPKNASVIKVTALDRMILFDKDIDWSQFTFPCTLQTLIEQTCTLCGVTLATDLTTLPNYDYTITYNPETTLPYRNLIQWGAFLTGTCALMNKNGELVFKWYTDCGVTIGPGQRYSHEIEEQDIVISGVYYKAESGLEYFAGTADYCLEMSGCQILQNNVETAIANINTARNGFTYRPFSAVIQSAPFLEPLDMITFTDSKGVDHPCIISKITYTANASTPVSGVGETPTQASYANLSGLTREQTEAVDDAKKYATNYLSADDTGIMIADMTDGNRYLPSNVPGGVKNTFIDNDSVDIRNGLEVLASFGITTIIGKESTAHLEQSSTGLRIVGAESDDEILMGAQDTTTKTREEVYTVKGYDSDDTSTIVPGLLIVTLSEERTPGQYISVTIDNVQTTFVGDQSYVYTGTDYTIRYDGDQTIRIVNNSASQKDVLISYRITQPSNYGVFTTTSEIAQMNVGVHQGGNMQANGGIRANSSGAVGLYDSNHSQWMIYAEADGLVKIPSLIPKLLYAGKVTAPASQYTWGYMDISLSGWAVIAVRAYVHNVFQYLLFFSATSGSSQAISDRPTSSLYMRGAFRAVWEENRIYLRWVDGTTSFYQTVYIDQVVGLIRK